MGNFHLLKMGHFSVSCEFEYLCRLLQHSGVYPDFTTEPSNLASGRPNVENVTLLLDDWWGSGIVHAKVWISDRRDVYIGSANNDWKSLTQVLSPAIHNVFISLGSREATNLFFIGAWPN